MDTQDVVIAVLYIGFQLQTKSGKHEEQGAFIDEYQNFRKEFFEKADKKEGRSAAARA